MENKSVSVTFLIFSKNDIYDLEKTFDKIIKVIQLNNISDYEIILIDNNSADNTLDKMEEIKSQNFNHNIKVSHEVNVGISSAIAKGLSLATKEICLPIPGHDLWSLNAISTVIGNSNKDSLCLGWRQNKFRYRPTLKAITSYIYVQLVNKIFKTNFYDVNGLVSFPTNFLRKTIQRNLGHSHALIPLVLAFHKKFKIIQVPVELNNEHMKRLGKKFSSNFPKLKDIRSTVKGILYLYSQLK